MLSRDIAEKGIYPAVDPLDSSSRMMDPRVVGDEHYDGRARRPEAAAGLQVAAGHHRHPGHGRAVRGRQADGRARPKGLQVPVAASFSVAEIFTGFAGKFVPLETAIKDFGEVLNGDYDDLPEAAFYMVGGIDDASRRRRPLRPRPPTAVFPEKAVARG